MATTFRLCTASDTSLLAWLVLDWHAVEGQRLDAGAVRRALGRFLQDSQPGHAWIIEQSGLAVGYAMLTFSAPGHVPHPRAYVSALYLAPEHRGRGLGRRARQFLLDVGAALRLPVAAFGVEGEAKHAALLSRALAPASGPLTEYIQEAVA